MDKIEWICVLIALTVIEMVCLWCVDISVSAMINNGIVMNSLYALNPVISYHVALYGILTTFLITIFITVHYILEEKK